MQTSNELVLEILSKVFSGVHNIPWTKKRLVPWGDGWSCNIHRNLSTYDNDSLTRLVVLCHDACIRLEISPSGPGLLRLSFWQRDGRDGRLYARHPTLEDNVKRIRGNRDGGIEEDAARYRAIRDGALPPGSSEQSSDRINGITREALDDDC